MPPRPGWCGSSILKCAIKGNNFQVLIKPEEDHPVSHTLRIGTEWKGYPGSV